MLQEVSRQPIRVMLVEDHADFRQVMVSMLGRQPDLDVVAEAGSLADARHCVEAANFEVAVLDLGLPDGNGADLIQELHEAAPGVAVLVLSASLDAANLARAREAGADGMLDKLSSPDEIIGEIRRLGSR